MTRPQAWWLHAANLLVGGTGIAYGVMRYLITPQDEFAVVNHPLQPHAQHLHVLFAPALVFAVGWIWERHASARWRKDFKPRRKSGVSLMYLIFPMTFSAYLLQISVDDLWRQIWMVVHVGVSLLWLGGYLAHQLGAKK